MRISEKLQKRLADDFGLDVELPERIPRGRHGAAGGQWAWVARLKSGAGDIGSEDTMTDCVKAVRLGGYRHERTLAFAVVAEDT